MLHLWSLAIEEQFYLLWPLLFAASAWLGGRRTLFGVALAGAIASATWMALLHADGTNTTRLYYGTDTRASGLLLGAALAAAWTVPANAYPAAARRLLDIAGGAALLALAGFALLITEDSHFLYAGGFFTVDLLTAVLIVAVVAPGGLVARGLSASPLRWVGLRSYGLYLWHWPVMLVFTPSFGSPAGPYAALVLQLAVSGVLAAASYRLLEQPIRRGALGRLWARARQPGLVNRLGYASGLGSIAAAVLAVGMVASTAGPEEQPPYFAMDSYRVLNPVVPTEFDVAPPMDSDVSGVSYYGPRYESDVSDDPWVQELGRAMRGEQPAAGEPKVIYSPQEEMELVTETTLLPREPSAATRAGILVTAIGDSVMLGAAPAMAAHIEGLDVDAAVSRAMVAAIGELERRAANDTLADVVVVHIGNNGPIDDEEIDRIASIVGSRKTFFVNLRVPRAWEAENNAVLERAAERYANFELIDWRDVSEAHPEILWTDGIHLRPSGASVYVEMIIAALER